MTSSIDSDTVGSFRTHANYLDAFAHLMGFGGVQGGPEALTRLGVRVQSAIKGHAPNTTMTDPQTVLACLNRGWGTEMLLNSSRRMANEDELTRLANSWGVIQLYYVSYAATQALLVAEGHSRPEAHAATQRKVEQLWVNRRFSVEPWSLAVASTANNRTSPDGSMNGPSRSLDLSYHGWSQCNPHSCWDLAATAISSTRKRDLKNKQSQARIDKAKQKKKRWNAEERERIAHGKRPRKSPSFGTSNLTTDEKDQVEAEHRPYTMMDYLYRLRIKANYEDAKMFTDGPERPDQSEHVSRTLARLAAGTLLAHELRIGQLMGKATLMSAVDSWIASNIPANEKRGLKMRRDILDQCL